MVERICAIFKLDGIAHTQWEGMMTIREVSRRREGIMLKIDGKNEDNKAHQQIELFFNDMDAEDILRAMYKILKDEGKI